MRLAYADRSRWLGDTDFVRVPVAGLVSDAYLSQRSELISLERAIPHVEAGTPPGARLIAAPEPAPADGGTSHFVVADRWGDVASMTSTIEAGFGSGLIVDGYMLNNELTDFTFVPEQEGVPVANRVQPGKRPLSSMSPTIVYGPDGHVVLAIGAAGGLTIISQVAKALIGVLDWHLPVDQAIALPQIMGVGDNVIVEQGTRLDAMVPALRALGHHVRAVPFESGGHSLLKLNAVEMTPRGWHGAADPRSEGVARTEQGD